MDYSKNEIIELLFKRKTDNIYLQMFRYCFVGGISFLIDFFIYIGLIEYNLKPSLQLIKNMGLGKSV